MSEAEYKLLCKRLGGTPATSSTQGKRRGLEQEYFIHHRQQGIRLRKKYRP